jgi:hypothetical protein
LIDSKTGDPPFAKASIFGLIDQLAAAYYELEKDDDGEIANEASSRGIVRKTAGG